MSAQNLACSFEGWRLNRYRYGGRFPAVLSSVEARDRWSQQQIEAIRDERISSFIQHAAHTVPYYSRMFDDLGVDPREIRTLEDLRALPILTKDEIQDHAQDLLSRAIPPRQRQSVHTSGTTGGGLRFSTTRDAIQEQWAVWWRFRRWHGIMQPAWCAFFGTRTVVPTYQSQPPFWRYSYPTKQIYFSAYHMSPDTLGLYVEEIRRKQPPWIHGYPSLIALIAGYIVDTGIDLGYQIRWVTTGAENLLEHQARAFREAFGVQPRQNYGLAEAVINASECPEGRMHVDEDFAAAEFERQETTGGYRVIGTNFTNYATPLIRYDTGDVAASIVGSESCSCGRPGRIIESLDGRKEDYVVLANGIRLGRMDYIFKDLVNIREAQFYQQTPGAFTLRVVRGPHYTDADEAMLLHETHLRVGADTQVKLQYLDRIQRPPSGKLRFVISDIPDAKL